MNTLQLIRNMMDERVARLDQLIAETPGGSKIFAARSREVELMRAEIQDIFAEVARLEAKDARVAS